MSSVSRTRPEAWWWGAMASAGGCAILAVTVSTQSWAEWFTHPAFGVFQDSWQNHVAGAKLLRVMLGVSCVAIGLYAVALRRLLRTQNPAPNAQNCAHKARSLEQWIVLSIVLVGMLLRMTRLGESLWYDEVASWLSYGVNVHSPGPIVGNYFDPVNHIFHTLLSWASVEAFSETLGFDLALRLPAFVFSVLTVVVMWGLGRSTQEPAARAQEEEVRGQRSAVSQEERAGEGRRSRRSSLQLFSQGESGFVGLIAAGLSAVLPVFVLEGAEARGYSQMMFFTALSTWMLVETWKRPCGWRWGVYVIANVLGVWSQFVTAFAAFGQTAWMTWRGVQCREWRRWWMGMTCLALAGILSVMVVSPVLPELRKEKEVFTSSRGDEPSVFGAEGQHALMQLGGAWYWWSALPGLVLVVAGVVGGRIQKPGDRRQEEDRPSPAPAKPGAPSPKGRGNEATAHRVSAREVGAMGLIGLLVFVAGISLAGSWMYARFVLFSLPGVVVVMASGIEWLWSRKIWM
ncbi:MAG TPA: hypothetical protein VG711_07765, partial [Phycisphaerales bacterium]|nr:hypothetical protein [Phycisphaerales bacterium]